MKYIKRHIEETVKAYRGNGNGIFGYVSRRTGDGPETSR